MSVQRRSFLQAGLALGLGRLMAKSPAKFKIGVTDWNLKMSSQIDAVALAKSIGFDGVQLSLGQQTPEGKLKLDNAEIQANYIAEAKKNKIVLDGTCLEILHKNYLKNDKLGQKWVADSIPITKKLNARIVLLPFFGKGAMTTPAEMEYVGDILKDLAPEAEKAGILLGLEDTNSAEENVRIMDRTKSKAVQVYYDVGNSTFNGFEVVKEIRWLGKERICQIHLKDKGYMGEGTIDFPAVLKAMEEIGYAGWANLETNSPSKDIPADMKRNLGFVRKLLAAG